MQILLIFKNVQLGAWLMACYLKGLNEQETSDLTKASISEGYEGRWTSEK